MTETEKIRGKIKEKDLKERVLKSAKRSNAKSLSPVTRHPERRGFFCLFGGLRLALRFSPLALRFSLCGSSHNSGRFSSAPFVTKIRFSDQWKKTSKTESDLRFEGI